jgi:hypothetical protein
LGGRADASQRSLPSGVPLGFRIIGCSQLKGIKPKIRRHKLRHGVYRPGVLKQKDIKQVSINTPTNTQLILLYNGLPTCFDPLGSSSGLYIEYQRLRIKICSKY